MDTPTLIATVAVCLFGSGGIVIWLLNRHGDGGERPQGLGDRRARDGSGSPPEEGGLR